MRQVRVLLVEDHDFTRATVAAGLRAEQCLIVASVPSARDAMRAVNEHQIDCAVIDFDLGLGPTGLDLAHRLREHDPEMALVLLTTYRDPRLNSGNERPLPRGAQYVVKDDVRSTSQLREVIDIALGEVSRPVPQRAGRLPLTDTQMEILRMVADGLTNAEIARRRGVTERSVQAALTRILSAVDIEPAPGVSPRVQLVQYYHSVGGRRGVV